MGDPGWLVPIGFSCPRISCRSTDSSDSSSAASSSSDDDDDGTSADGAASLPPAAGDGRRTRRNPRRQRKCHKRSLGDTDDEGIERDHDDDGGSGCGCAPAGQAAPSAAAAPSTSAGKKDSTASVSAAPPGGSLERVLELCANHLSVRSEAEAHFRAVCRALVSESLELSFFLMRTKATREEHDGDEELQQLALQDWVS